MPRIDPARLPTGLAWHLVAGVALLAACAGPAPVATGVLPAISGMAAAGAGTWLVVQDGRLAGDARIGLVQCDDHDGARYRRLALDERSLDGHLTDLEAIAAVPDRPGEFLLLESGAHPDGEPMRRRLVHLWLSREAARAEILAVVDLSAATRSLANCESLLCWRHGDALRTLVADRGQDAAAFAYVTGTLALAAGADEPRRGAFTGHASGAAAATGAWPGPRARACGDLLLDRHGDIWSVATLDLGPTGPFGAVIARSGRLDPATGWPTFAPAEPSYRCDGFKVEALAQDEVGGLWIAVDDEAFGGALRALPPLR